MEQLKQMVKRNGQKTMLLMKAVQSYIASTLQPIAVH